MGLAAAIVLIQPLPRNVLPISLVVVATAFWLWAVVNLGFGQVTVQPTPHPDTRLVTTGPFQIVRHPMYLALFVFCSGFVAAHWNWLSTVLWLLLAGVLHQKAVVEELELVQRHPRYSEYKRKTSRFLPGIY